MFKQRVAITYDKHIIVAYFKANSLNDKGSIHETNRITAKVKETIRDRDDTRQNLTALQLCEKLLKDLHPYCYRVDITTQNVTSSYEK